MDNQVTSTTDSFRVPNSIVQGLTTPTATDLNSLSAFQMVTLFGLLSKVSQKDPRREVRMTVSEILRIIEVGEIVDHAVTRGWETIKGEKRQRTYSGRRFSPAHMQRIQEALLVLHDKKVVIRRKHKRWTGVSNCIVHVLDSFGYVYERNGEALDFDDLPPGSEKVNVGTEDRPVFRVRKLAGEQKQFERPSGVLFRLNTELADELNKKGKGTIGYTLFARKVFGLLQKHMRKPAAIRLIILILRQTGQEFTRNFSTAIEGLGWATTHPGRAAAECEKTLSSLQAEGLVTSFELDRVSGKLRIEINREWYRNEP